ncbi:50S ribosomal protein L3 [Chloracidobacterium aggregatum]|jgi:large subunit ribosomal protein L3|uniref:Large ribosomal subunit protein uL3 n=1 Tax=Chloracidobacterium sp. N TaxID=2821540 RepID=A0ABX8AWW4_9BACT|nr:50S ribosomal protein L3 [Chloracidobacterium aggregatum]QUV84435.1 50S ribosomal protein L3 [Chloracidobacterium sp. 2]QUV87071.1 50S ribosomal protein L3 [Chloracidobacterium sp. S]QUV89981.1 50S ribosomal protein L3 [Chloracidobacterium sp. A]QUV93192.1 50S ribosomal protein L3 [Chloracidobacterium sp. N]QUV96347.1 50S ribosomal protein L3 [Chloracidobacterium sp. E]
MSGILGVKVGMTQIFQENGLLVPVTVIKAGPCVVTQHKTKAKDGYDAIQVGLVEAKGPKKVTKPLRGHFEKTAKGTPPTRLLKEFRVESAADFPIGSLVLANIFSSNELVTITGKSKGRGFAGFVKRHGFGGGRATHGSMFHRAPGSIGASAFPSRVFKGSRMAGHMGNKNCTVKNLRIVKVDENAGVILVRGAVPGANGTYLVIKKASS